MTLVAAMPLPFECYCFCNFWFSEFFTLTQTKKHVWLSTARKLQWASCGGSVLASIGMHARVNIKNNQLVRWWCQLQCNKSFVACCCGNATASEPHHPFHSTEVFNLFFDCFAFALETNKICVAPPANCSCGMSWRQDACVHGMHARFKVKNYQLVQWPHQLTMQQVICGACCGDDSNASHVNWLKISFVSWLFCICCRNKNNMCCATSKLQWWHLVEAACLCPWHACKY